MKKLDDAKSRIEMENFSNSLHGFEVQLVFYFCFSSEKVGINTWVQKIINSTNLVESHDIFYSALCTITIFFGDAMRLFFIS